MPHPNDFPRLPFTRPEEVERSARSVEGARLFSVVVISTVGSEVHADTTLELARTADDAKSAAIAGMKKGRLLQKVDAFHISRDRLEAALRVVVD